jgi:hypothetical protein
MAVTQILKNIVMKHMQFYSNKFMKLFVVILLLLQIPMLLSVNKIKVFIYFNYLFILLCYYCTITGQNIATMFWNRLYRYRLFKHKQMHEWKAIVYPEKKNNILLKTRLRSCE